MSPVSVPEWPRSASPVLCPPLQKREKRALGNWKLLVKGLLIRERLKLRYGAQVSVAWEDDVPWGGLGNHGRFCLELRAAVFQYRKPVSPGPCALSVLSKVSQSQAVGPAPSAHGSPPWAGPGAEPTRADGCLQLLASYCPRLQPPPLSFRPFRSTVAPEGSCWGHRCPQAQPHGVVGQYWVMDVETRSRSICPLLRSLMPPLPAPCSHRLLPPAQAFCPCLPRLKASRAAPSEHRH